jgi:hypothetical protein
MVVAIACALAAGAAAAWFFGGGAVSRTALLYWVSIPAGIVAGATTPIVQWFWARGHDDGPDDRDGANAS